MDERLQRGRIKKKNETFTKALLNSHGIADGEGCQEKKRRPPTAEELALEREKKQRRGEEKHRSKGE